MSERVDLMRVARVYEEAVRQAIPPRKAVAEVFGMAPSTASSWIATARKLGLLPSGVQQHRPAWAEIHRGTTRHKRWQVCDTCLCPWEECTKR